MKNILLALVAAFAIGVVGTTVVACDGEACHEGDSGCGEGGEGGEGGHHEGGGGHHEGGAGGSGGAGGN